MTGFSVQMEEARKRNVMATEIAMKPIPYDPAKLPDRMGIEPKIDGIGLLDVNGNVQTIEAGEFAAAAHLAHELASIRQAFGTPMVLHGEFVEPGGFHRTLSAFRAGKSEGGIVILWDAVPLKVWAGYEQSMPLWQRRSLLQAAVDSIRPGMVAVNRLAEIDPDDELVQAAMRNVLETDPGPASRFDGIVTKDMDAPYQRGPSSYWMKVKPCETVDVSIQSVRAEESGRVKSVVVTFEGKPVVVGAGISETLRLQPDEFAPGRLVEIRHVGRTPEGALRGTSFVRFRDDKEKTR